MYYCRRIPSRRMVKEAQDFAHPKLAEELDTGELF